MNRLTVAVLALLSLSCTFSSARDDTSTPAEGISPIADSARSQGLPASTPKSKPLRAQQPTFDGSIHGMDAATQGRMSYSWRAGCPVGFKDLRLLDLDFWGFDERAHRGEVVVHRDVALDVLGVFRKLYDARFPIQRMVLVDVYGGDDDRSMAANNTSAFNCRQSVGSPGRWSEHSYGRAIDINPVQNPYVSDGDVKPPAGIGYVDRSSREPGMIRSGDVVVGAFSAIGWTWGGTYRNVKDFQHFSRGGT